MRYDFFGFKRPRNINIHPDAYQEEVHYQVWKSLRSYLLKLYSGKEKSELFKIKYIFTFYESNGIVTEPYIAGLDTFDNILNGLTTLICIIRYKDKEYFLSTSTIETHNGTIFMINVNTTKQFEDSHPVNLVNDLIRESMMKSGYVGKVLRIVNDIETSEIILKEVERAGIRLKDLFLKDKAELEDFINAVKDNSHGLRYLFVGEPGTGKTDTVKAIISECSEVNNKLTTIVVDGGCAVSLEKIFEYASMFSPVLLCIDDLDLIVGSRDSRFQKRDLSSSLQIFDGFLTKKDMFIIATTNDRLLVDKALKRPGRFDIIIEFNYLEPEFYSLLVLRETNDKKLADIFDNASIRKELFKINATGAFIVTLVKYLSRVRFKDSKYEIKTIKSAIDTLYKSFKPDIKQTGEVGFNIEE